LIGAAHTGKVNISDKKYPWDAKNVSHGYLLYRMLAALQMFGRNKRGVRFANEFCE